MTVIAIRDGIMAVDSLAVRNGIIVGTCKKWVEIPDEFGGGFAAGSGTLSGVVSAMAQLAETGKVEKMPDDCSVIWLNKSEVVTVFEAAGQHIIQADFHAYGSGMFVALGAMFAGASAVQSVEASIAMDTDCGGPACVLSVRT